MKRMFVTLTCGIFAVAAFSFFDATPASATPQIKKAFTKKYIGTDKAGSLAMAAKKAKCNVCHDRKKGERSWKKMNSYGTALAKLIGKKDNKDTAKINKALDTVGAMKAASGSTFGALITAGKLPCNK